MTKLVTLVLLIATLALPSFAQIKLQNITVTPEQVQQITEKLQRLPEDKVFYHWSDFDSWLRWNTQGHIDKGEMDFLNSQHAGQAAGGGYYLAGNPISSRNYGPFCTVLKIKKGTLIWNQAAVNQILKVPGYGLSFQDKAELGKVIPFIDPYSAGGATDWWMTHNAEHTRSLEDPIDYDVTPGLISQVEILKKIEVQPMNNGAREYLKNIFYLSEYMDGISLLRAMKVNPSQPWKEFEPQNFENFKKAYKKWASAPTDTVGPTDYLNSDKEANGTFQVKWAKRQVEEVLPTLFSDVSGINADKVSFRDEGIRAGGDHQGRRMFISASELAALRANPYIEVTATPFEDGFLAEYFYPDAFHFKKLKNKLSPELYAELEAQDPASLMNDSPKRKRLNQRIIKELLFELFNKTSVAAVRYAEFYQSLISIHPFPDFNGRVIRLYVSVVQKFMAPPGFFISDYDMFSTPQTLSKLMEIGRAHLNSFLIESLLESVRAEQQHRMARIAENKSLNKMLTTLALSFGAAKPTRTDLDWELVRRRDFFRVAKSLLGERAYLPLPQALEKTISVLEEFQYTEQIKKLKELLKKEVRDGLYKEYYFVYALGLYKAGKLSESDISEIVSGLPLFREGKNSTLDAITDVIRKVDSSLYGTFNRLWGKKILQLIGNPHFNAKVDAETYEAILQGAQLISRDRARFELKKLAVAQKAKPTAHRKAALEVLAFIAVNIFSARGQELADNMEFAVDFDLLDRNKDWDSYAANMLLVACERKEVKFEDAYRIIMKISRKAVAENYSKFFEKFNYGLLAQMKINQKLIRDLARLLESIKKADGTPHPEFGKINSVPLVEVYKAMVLKAASGCKPKLENLRDPRNDPPG